MMLDYGGVQFAIDIPSNSVKIELEACWNTTIGQACKWFIL
jgi:hypothetical protein